MNDSFDLQEYVTLGVEHIMADVLRATLKDPKESAFMLKFAAAAKSASKKRMRAKEEGQHIPPFMIASITSECNLHCAGCYSRCNHATVDEVPHDQLSADEWSRIFNEAEDIGMSFIVLLGGEPMLRRDVIDVAASHKNIMFPIFTNGTFIGEHYFSLFDKHRNLIPILSIEGDKERTDMRRGEGVFDMLTQNMAALKRSGLIFGASITVTTENIHEVTDATYLRSLYAQGCKAVFFVEYVPVSDGSIDLAPQDEERDYLKKSVSSLRTKIPDMVFISFPGDEKSSGGCIAAGRGFFHINSHGDAEPCPMSPYSDINVKDHSLIDALNSPLFEELRNNNILLEDHAGGCVLYEKKNQVEAILG